MTPLFNHADLHVLFFLVSLARKDCFLTKVHDICLLLPTFTSFLELALPCFLALAFLSFYFYQASCTPQTVTFLGVSHFLCFLTLVLLSCTHSFLGHSFFGISSPKYSSFPEYLFCHGRKMCFLVNCISFHISSSLDENKMPYIVVSTKNYKEYYKATEIRSFSSGIFETL